MPQTRQARGADRLSPAAVVDAGVALAREHGLDAVTVRRVAHVLGVYPATVYHHVGGQREELVAAVVDRLAADVPVAPTEGPWRTRLAAAAHDVHPMLLAYPGLADYLQVSPLAGPNARRIRDDVMSVLADAGLSPEDALDAYRVFFGYIFGDTRPANADVNYLTRDAGPELFARGLDIVIAGIAALADRRSRR
jgi:AcrR family transcriptional regulator